MNILLLGSKGQLGRELERQLSSVGSVAAFTRTSLDITDFSAVNDAIRCLSPNIIVNAAAYTSVDEAEKDFATTFAVNSKAVAHLAELAKTENTWLIHYSTDYVFDGTKPKPYLESDATNPINVYGASKLAGEQAIARADCQNLVFRTTWTISKYPKSFVREIIHKAMKQYTLDVVKDQVGVTTSTKLIAQVTVDACNAVKKGASWPRGIYNLVPRGSSNRHEIAQTALSLAEKSNIILKARSADIRAITTSEYTSAAQRPLNSQLDTQKLRAQLSFDLPHWKDDFLAVAYDIIKELGVA